MLGRTGEAEEYRRLAQAIASRFAGDYLDADGKLEGEHPNRARAGAGIRSDDTEGCHSAGIAQHLADLIAKNDYRMATGFLGTKPLLPVLSAFGHHDLAVRLFQSRRFPSWGYEVEQGATSVWERWDSFTKEHGFNGAKGDQNASMNSFSHYSFGAVMQWAFQTLAGIDTAGPGFKHVLIQPRPPTPGSNPEQKPVEWVRARYDSVRGRIVSDWRRTTTGFELRVTIPPNTTATVHVPASSLDSVQEGKWPAIKAKGVRSFRFERGAAVFEVESGSYRFTSALPTKT